MSNNDRPVKKVRLLTEQHKPLELKQTSQELIKQVKCLTDDVRDMIEKCEQHLWKKHPSHKQSSVIRIEEQLSVAKQLYDNVVNNKNSIKINLALISGTGRGKSYIANSLALYGTPMFDKSQMNCLVPLWTSSTALDKRFDCLTGIVSFKLIFRAKLVMKSKSDQAFDTEMALFAKRLPRNINLQNGKIWEDMLSEMRQKIDETMEGVKQGNIDLRMCKYFEIEAPFPLLGQYNLSIMEISGLSTADVDLVNSAIETGEEANVIALVGCPEKLEPEMLEPEMLEPEDLNQIEPFVNRDVDDVPPIIFIDNCSRRGKDTKGNDQDACSTLLDFVVQHRAHAQVFPQISGAKRNVIMDKILSTGFGCAFYGPGYESPFSELFSPVQKGGHSTIELCRRHLEERELRQAKTKALACINALEN